MEITYNATLNKRNIAAHGIPLVHARLLEWETLRCKRDERHGTEEVHYIGYAYIGPRLFCVAFIESARHRYVVSLRKAYCRETLHYGDLKPITITPTPEEEIAIRHGISVDPDTYELCETEFELLQSRGFWIGNRATEPQEATPNAQIDPDLLDRFKASGPDWQTRINAVLAEWLNAHSPQKSANDIAI